MLQLFVVATGYRDEASFYRAALLLGLVKGETVVAWSDAVIARDPDAPAAFVEISSTAPADLSGLRDALFPLCDPREVPSPAVVRAVLGQVSRDLTVGRRSFNDTMTVLSQVRKFLRVDPATNDALRRLAVDLWQARHNPGGELASAERRVRDWLRQYENDQVSVS
jgi:hypothetical protein